MWIRLIRDFHLIAKMIWPSSDHKIWSNQTWPYFQVGQTAFGQCGRNQKKLGPDGGGRRGRGEVEEGRGFTRFGPLHQKSWSLSLPYVFPFFFGHYVFYFLLFLFCGMFYFSFFSFLFFFCRRALVFPVQRRVSLAEGPHPKC